MCTDNAEQIKISTKNSIKTRSRKGLSRHLVVGFHARHSLIEEFLRFVGRDRSAYWSFQSGYGGLGRGGVGAGNAAGKRVEDGHGRLDEGFGHEIRCPFYEHWRKSRCWRCDGR